MLSETRWNHLFPSKKNRSRIFSVVKAIPTRSTNTNLITIQERDIQVDKLHMNSLKFVKMMRQMWCFESINVPLELMVKISHTVQIGKVSMAPPPPQTLTWLQFAKPTLKTPEKGGGVSFGNYLCHLSSSLWMMIHRWCLICDAFLKWKKSILGSKLVINPQLFLSICTFWSFGLVPPHARHHSTPQNSSDSVLTVYLFCTFSFPSALH